MYQYDEHDQRIVDERAAQFKEQVRRRIAGEITEDEFRPLRLQNGLYLQLHAYMLRIAVPYGLLSTAQLRKLAHIARTYDKGYGHFTTRQNIQFNWPALEDVPKILEELASVQMHAIQTSGNCVRNITSDPFAGAAIDELEDPRPYCEVLRQWSTFHPEFLHLPRKFKIAVTGAQHDRAAIAVHDIGLRITKNAEGALGMEFWVGGGQGRTPQLAEKIRDFVPMRDLLSYTEAVLRIYNEDGRRDNKYKARIKVLVKETGVAEFTRRVEHEFERIRDDAGTLLAEHELERVKKFFAPLPYDASATGDLAAFTLHKDRGLARWVKNNVLPHRRPGYAIVQLSLKSPNLPPGDVTHAQMDAIADLADRYAMGLVVVTHRQNLVLRDVKVSELPALYAELVPLELATPNVGKPSDVIACPGLDYCDLANARSIPLAMAVQERLRPIEEEHEVGELYVNVSGCINACGHHHVGNIGILGIDKLGEEFYQVMLGGSHTEDASLGKVLGKALTGPEVIDGVERLVRAYLRLRHDEEESFLALMRRLGNEPFKEALYGAHPHAASL
jgi:sulfite reductase (NADPH) hemoprotein beta-component